METQFSTNGGGNLTMNLPGSGQNSSRN